MVRVVKRGTVRTHDFARGLLDCPNEFIRMWGSGRLWLVWDTNRTATVPTTEVLDTQPTEEEP